MTNVSSVKHAADVGRRVDAIDPIDLLVPAPRRRGARLVVGVVVVGVVAFVSWLFGFGYVYPQPDCCGSTDGSAQMSVNDARDAVQIGVVVGNSSGHALRVDGARAVLPGADVVDIGAVAWGPSLGFRVPFQPQPFPAPIDGLGDLLVVVTFVPTSCESADLRAIDVTAWGELRLDLEVVGNGPLPSLGRRYRVPGYVVDAGSRSLSVFPFPTDDGPTVQTSNPLVAACQLLGR